MSFAVPFKSDRNSISTLRPLSLSKICDLRQMIKKNHHFSPTKFFLF